MAFPNSIADEMPWGIVGESYLSVCGSVNAQPLTLNADVAGNPFGLAMTHVAGENGKAVVGGAGTFAGILAYPKEHVNFALPGDANSPLVAGMQVTGVTEHPGLLVNLTTDAAIGDGVAFDADGKLAAAPGATAPASHTLIQGAKVVRYNVTTGVAVISLKELPNAAAAAAK